MIREDLLDFQYYLDRLSKFMQESYGISGQVQTFFSMLEQVNAYYDKFYKQIDIFDYGKPKAGESPDPDYVHEGDILDKIGAIFGCYRKFTIPIYNDSNPLQIDDYRQIDLNDSEFLVYIKSQIIKQSFDGTRENLQTLYSTYVDGKLKEGLIGLRFLYITEDDESGAICTIRWDEENPSENLRLLFENGFLTIESLGILYRRSVTNFNKLAYYAKLDYTVLSSANAPADWGTAVNKYWAISVVSDATSSWDPSKTYAKPTTYGYAICPNQPSNWATAYSQYKIVTIAEKGSASYSPETFYTASQLTQSKYAKLLCALTASEPSGWAKGGFYKVSATSPTSSWYSSKVYAKAEGSEYAIIPHQPTNWSDSYSSCVILDVTDGTETWAENTYYAKTQIGGYYA